MSLVGLWYLSPLYCYWQIGPRQSSCAWLLECFLGVRHCVTSTLQTWGRNLPWKISTTFALIDRLTNFFQKHIIVLLGLFSISKASSAGVWPGELCEDALLTTEVKKLAWMNPDCRLRLLLSLNWRNRFIDIANFHSFRLQHWGESVILAVNLLKR